MKKIYYLIAALSFVFVSCLEKQIEEPQEQPDQQICTMEFRAVTVRFKDGSESYITVQDYKAILKRTGQVLYTSASFNNQYPVATDSDQTTLSKQGDTILVSAKHPVTGVLISAEFVVKGGVCHIEKISGPTEVVFN